MSERGSSSSLSTADRASRRPVYFAATGLVAATLLAYANSFSVPFVFDDSPAIIDNASIRHLGSLVDVLVPDQAGGVTTSGRPLVNLSLALNYAVSGEAVWSYHAVNVLVHVLAGLLLFGLVRRTCLGSASDRRLQEQALFIGVVAAGLWLLHPLQTESVTYIVQRAEALVSLFYLLTLYAFRRGCDSPRPRSWFVAAVIACLAGMATKEVMVSAPLLVLLYDRTFVASSFRDAWQRRSPVYIALGATWVLLIGLVVSTESRGGTAGFETIVSPLTYAATQARAIVHYLRLALWPHPLVFDYGTSTVRGWSAVWPQTLLLAGMLAGTVIALRRRSPIGFLGAWFFALLAPSSSIVPIASQTMAEHRVYLALAAVAVFAAAALYRWLGRPGVILGLLLAVGSAIGTHLRNADYASEARLWSDTVTKQPGNARAHHNLGLAAFKAGEVTDAVVHYRRALELAPTSSETHYNLGLALAKLGRWSEAIARYEEAVRLQPLYPDAHNNLGNALLQQGRAAEAAQHYREALSQRTDFAEAHSNLANAALELGEFADATRHASEAVRLKPDYVDAHYNLGNALAAAGQLQRAEAEYRATLRLAPNHIQARANLGNVLLEQDRIPAAIEEWTEAVRLAPRFAPPRRNLAFVLAHIGRRTEAIEHFRALLVLTPSDREAEAALQGLLQKPVYR